MGNALVGVAAYCMSNALVGVVSCFRGLLSHQESSSPEKFGAPRLSFLHAAVPAVVLQNNFTSVKCHTRIGAVLIVVAHLSSIAKTK